MRAVLAIFSLTIQKLSFLEPFYQDGPQGNICLSWGMFNLLHNARRQFIITHKCEL